MSILMRVVMRRSIQHAFVLSAGVIAAARGTGCAQVSGVNAGAGAHFESYKFRTPDSVNLASVSLLTLPVSGRALLPHNIELTVNGAFASATLTRPGGTQEKLSGLTDTEVRLTVSMAADKLRLSAVGLLPTGTSQLTAAEMDVAGVVAADVLPFAISNWGSGGGLGMNASVALPMNEETSFGFSGGYVVAREYTPLKENAFAYRPGNQLQLHGAADHTFGTAAKASLQVTYMHFAQDQSAGATLYQAGDRLQGVGSLAFARGATGTGIVYLGYLRRQQGQYTNVVTVTPAQDLVYAGTGFRHPIGQAVLVPSVDVRLLGNQAGTDQGSTVSVGTGLELGTGQIMLVPSARARFGSLTVRTGQKSGFTGFEVGFTVRSRTSP